MNRKMAGGNCKTVAHLFELYGSFGFNARRRKTFVPQHERQRHRKARSMRRSDELFRIAPGLRLKTRRHTIGGFSQSARFGRNHATAFLEAAFPDSRPFLDHFRSFSVGAIHAAFM